MTEKHADPPEPMVTLEIHYEALRQAVVCGEAVPAGRLWGLPDLGDEDVWVDIAGAAVIAQVKPKTLTGWLSRRGPKRRPFPAPTWLMHRLYWKRSVIQKWCQAQDRR